MLLEECTEPGNWMKRGVELCTNRPACSLTSPDRSSSSMRASEKSSLDSKGKFAALSCSNGDSFSGLLVIDDVLARTDPCEHFNSSPCSLKGLRRRYQMQLSVIEHIAEYSQDAEP